MTLFVGCDPGSVSGAIGVLDSMGDYASSFMIPHENKHIRAMLILALE